MTRFPVLFVVVVAASLGLPAGVQAQYAGSGILRCESRDFRDNYCPADTRGGVRLARQVSRQPCWEGETWGFDRRGIWVTKGCAGEFEVGGARGSGDRYGYQRGYQAPQTPPAYGGDPRYGYRGGGGANIVCESRDYRYRYCAVGVRGDVDLVRQLSKSPCRFDYSWGFDRGGVWVDRGCAAEFVVR